MLKDKLTIILLIKGRPKFTQRWLTYANKYLKDLKIIVADGSEIKERYKISKRISLIEGSSTDKDTVNKLKKIIKNSKKNLIILDSHHSHDHVLKELEIYTKFVGKGNYIIVGDTIVEDTPAQKHRLRPWGPGNSPKTAMKNFLKTNKRFEIDKSINEKILITCHPDGYLKAKY